MEHMDVCLCEGQKSTLCRAPDECLNERGGRR